MIIPLIGASYTSTSYDSNNQKCINMFPISVGEGGRGKGALIPSPGLTSLIDCGGTTCRGIIAIGNYVYVVANNTFYKLTIDLQTLTATKTSLGTIGTSAGPVKFARNPTQVLLVDGSANGYILTIATDAFAVIADADFVGGTTAVFCDGYFFYNQPGTALLRCSALNSGTTWDATDVATAESKPDNLVGLAVSKGELWAFGEETVEVWFDEANASGLPFSPRVGSEIDVGCGAFASIVEMDNLIMWLDNRGFIVQSQISAYVREQSSGYDLKIVGDEALHAEIASYTIISDAVAMSYNDRGHIIYQITFPTEQKTWAYDQATGVWTERNFYSSDLGRLVEHLTQYCCTFQNTTIACGSGSGNVYVMREDLYDDDGEPIRRIRRTGPISIENKLLSINRLELRMMSGLATVTGEGSDPYIGLRYSNDGGHTWSDELPRSIGTIGEYGKPITWYRLGTSREWIFEFTFSEPINFSFIECSISAEAEADGE